MADKHLITKIELDEVQAEYDKLIEIEIPKAQEELNFARSQGDLSENSDYDAAKEKFEALNAKKTELRDILDHHTIVQDVKEEAGARTARLGGGEITVRDLSRGKEHHFTITSSIKADPMNHKISNTCPVAQAIIGHKVGDICEVNVKVPYQLEIIDIADPESSKA